jgi:hypothetical protein
LKQALVKRNETKPELSLSTGEKGAVMVRIKRNGGVFVRCFGRGG